MKLHPSGILIGKKIKLKEPCTHYSWSDKRTPEEIQQDIEDRKNRRDQKELDQALSSPEAFENRKKKLELA